MKKNLWRSKKVWLMIAALGLSITTTLGYTTDSETFNKIVQMLVEILDVVDVLE